MYRPVQQWKRHAWRAGRMLQGEPEETTPLDKLDAAGRERFWERGQEQVARLAEQIDTHAGFTLENKRVLDFGCGVGRNSLALAERCEHVYGLDVSPKVLSQADEAAKRLNLSNVEWMEADRLAELSGNYDLVISVFVFQHIPTREGERTFATILQGLRPGGAGAIQVTLRPPRFRGPERAYFYMLRTSYSLNRLGRLLADAGITEWHVKLYPRPSHDDVTIIFRKDDVSG
jgi:2-polyprenyl-3-methyl-5-hydroxy-6-metoxy-1,4-benzoquinol methylase